MAEVRVGKATAGLAYDGTSGNVFVTNSYEGESGNSTGNVSVISDATNKVVAIVPVGVQPIAATGDPISGDVYVSNFQQGTLSILTPGSPAPRSLVTFTESGLPVDTSWNVTLGALTHSSSAATIDFTEPNGTYPFTVGAIAGYTITTPTGYVTVNGTNVTVAVHFTPIPPETYTVDFTESGLGAGAQWAVDFNNVTQQGKGTTIIFGDIPNGTYSFAIMPISNYDISPESGSVTIEGGNQVQKVNFTEIHVPLETSINWTTVSGTGFCGGAPFSATVQFFGNTTGGSPPYTFAWNFGDNASTSTVQNPRYTYTTGPFVAGLAVTDSRGTTVNKSVTLLFVSGCPPSTAYPFGPLPFAILVISLIIAISVGSVAHRITRVKPRAK